MNSHRCGWVKLTNETYVDYHDNEWGKALHEDKALFELFSLETQAAGLSWLTVLLKRDEYKKAFYDFDIKKVILMNENDVENIIKNYNVIKNKPKLLAIINNAKLIAEIINEFGSWNNFLWSYIDNTQLVNHFENYKEAPTTSLISHKLTKDLKKRGFKFVGSVTIYAFMQACGMIDDHEDGCFCKHN